MVDDSVGFVAKGVAGDCFEWFWFLTIIAFSSSDLEDIILDIDLGKGHGGLSD